MKRLHLFELEDFSWFPSGARDTDTDLLRFALQMKNRYKDALPRIIAALRTTGAARIVDRCSGGGGPIPILASALADEGWESSIILTDKYPNLAAFEFLKGREDGLIDFEPNPVDATAVSPSMTGLRTVFTALHHLRPEMVLQMLQDAVNAGQPIAAFEMSQRGLVQFLSAVFIHPLMVHWQCRSSGPSGGSVCSGRIWCH